MKARSLPLSPGRFCFKKWCIECLLFYKEVLRYRSAENREELANDIRKRFLDPDSPMTLNLDDGVGEEIIGKFEKGAIDENLFIKAEKDVKHFLIYGVFMEWENTQSSSLLRHRESFGQRSRISDAHEMPVLTGI